MRCAAAAHVLFAGMLFSRLPMLLMAARNNVLRAFSKTGLPMPAVYTASQIAVAHAIWSFFEEKGYDDLGCAAWCGNTEGETAFDIHVWGDNHEAVDIVQHHAGRRALIFQHTGIDMTTADIAGQLAGVYAEITAPWSAYREVDAAIRAAPDLRSKVTIIVAKEEQSASQASDEDKRTGDASYWLTYGRVHFKDASPPPVVATAKVTRLAVAPSPAAAAGIIKLPVLKSLPSPNHYDAEMKPDLLVLHDCEGSYAGAISWFSQRASEVSAHLVLKEDGSEATQMVPFDRAAWHARSFNGRSVALEMGGTAKRGFPDVEWQTGANIIAYLLHHLGIPCRFAKGGVGPGFCRHYDLGAAGGSHYDPTTSDPIWNAIVERIGQAYAAKWSGEWKVGAPPPVAAKTLPPPPSIAAARPPVQPASLFASPPSGSSPASASDSPAATNKTENITMGNLLGSVASMFTGVAGDLSSVIEVGSLAPSLIGGAVKAVPDGEKAVAALTELVSDIRGNRWSETPEDITAVLTAGKKILVDFGVDHDALNAAAAKIKTTPALATLQLAKAA